MNIDDLKITYGENSYQTASIERNDKTIDYEMSSQISYLEILSIAKGLSVVSEFYDVKAFYEATLPQLGWAKKNSGKRKSSFEREGEILEISEETPSPLIVRITVKSKN